MPAQTNEARSLRTSSPSQALCFATIFLALSANVAWSVSETPLPPDASASALSFNDLVATQSQFDGADSDSDWTALDEDSENIILTGEELEELVSRVALYPEELLAAVLAASTFPVEIVQASRYLDQLASEPDLEPDPEWDESILALLNYPEVLEMMNNDLDWTWDLGEAVIGDQTIVMDSIQVFRRKVQAAGNLESNERRVVIVGDESIAIGSADSEVVYVPVYRPARVVVTYSGAYPYNYWGPYPWYYYSSAPYWTGWYGGVGYAFGVGWGWRAPFHRPIITHHRVHGSKRSHRVDNPTSRRGEKRAWRSERSRGKSGARPRRSKHATRRSGDRDSSGGSVRRGESGRGGESNVIGHHDQRREQRSSSETRPNRRERSSSESGRRSNRRDGDDSSTRSRDRGSSRRSYRQLLSESRISGGRSKGVSRSSSHSGRSSRRTFRSSSGSGGMKSRSRGSSSSHRASRSSGGGGRSSRSSGRNTSSGRPGGARRR
jgi:hypothetical protein